MKNYKQMYAQLLYVMPLQVIAAYYKALWGGDEAKEERDKQLAAYEKELNDRNTKFIGGEPS